MGRGGYGNHTGPPAYGMNYGGNRYPNPLPPLGDRDDFHGGGYNNFRGGGGRGGFGGGGGGRGPRPGGNYGNDRLGGAGGGQRFDNNDRGFAPRPRRDSERSRTSVSEDFKEPTPGKEGWSFRLSLQLLSC